MKPTVFPSLPERETSLRGLAPAAPTVLGIVGGAALALAVVLGSFRGDAFRSFLHSYLTNYCFFLSLSLGSLFFVAALHATRAGWGVSVRRIAEVLGANIAVLAVLFLPILLPLIWGNSSLYEWNNPAVVQEEAALQYKHPYLNVPFFAIRAVAYFAIWWLVAQFFLRRSTEQDATGDARLTIQMERWSGPALLALGVTGTFAAFDWLMSLEPLWYSTIFGLYFYAGAVLGAFALIILAAMAFQANGRLRAAVTVEHYHDLGKLLFAAVVFWGYMAFSQYLLIWYGNIPEETQWYKLRLSGPWGWVALVLMFGQLLIPFFGLLSREFKRRKPVLAFWCVWLLAMHWLDVAWLVMPEVQGEGPPLGLADLCLLVGLGSLYLAGAWRIAAARSLVPLRDPRLGEALAFENL